jgi:acetyl esterase/lipase
MSDIAQNEDCGTQQWIGGLMAWKRLAACLFVALPALGMAAMAQEPMPAVPSSPAIAAVAELGAIPLYGNRTPGNKSSETWFKWYEGQAISVRNVTYPTLTPVLPDPAKATGAAVIVAPGGAFEFLSIEHEGWNIAHALADRGVAAFVLKYRVKPTPADQNVWMGNLMRAIAQMGARNKQPRPASETANGAPEPGSPLEFSQATDDAFAALSLVRSRATSWSVDPKRVGMIGFSAGAAATLSAVLAAKQGRGPDFFGLIYGPLARVPVPPQAPPLFAAMAFDDPLFTDFSLVSAWHEAGRPVELHVYQSGGHGFGLGRPGTSAGMMIEEFMTWMAMQGFTKRSEADNLKEGGR